MQLWETIEDLKAMLFLLREDYDYDTVLLELASRDYAGIVELLYSTGLISREDRDKLMRREKPVLAEEYIDEALYD